MRTETLTIKSGPTESGKAPSTVGGSTVPVNSLSVFLSNFWFLLLLIFILPIAVLLYKNRGATMKFLSPLISRFFEYRRLL